MWQYRNKDKIGFGEAVVKLFVFTFIIRSSSVCHFVCLFVVSLFVCLLFVVCCLFVCLFVFTLYHLLQVPRRIFETNNATKLVLIVRNPVDRLVSDYNQFRSRKLDRLFFSSARTSKTRRLKPLQASYFWNLAQPYCMYYVLEMANWFYPLNFSGIILSLYSTNSETPFNMHQLRLKDKMKLLFGFNETLFHIQIFILQGEWRVSLLPLFHFIEYWKFIWQRRGVSLCGRYLGSIFKYQMRDVQEY